MQMHVFRGNIRHEDNCSGAKLILIRQVVSKGGVTFSMQVIFQNLTLCRVREKDGHNHAR